MKATNIVLQVQIERKARGTWQHCPFANMSLHSMLANVRRATRKDE